MAVEMLPVGSAGISTSESGNGIRADAQAGAVAPPAQDAVGTDIEVPRYEGMAEWEIRSLLWMDELGNEVFARAHLEWQRKVELFTSRIDKKKKQSSSLRNEIYQLFGFYSVFQGVLLTAVAQSNLLRCNNWWTAFSLSAFAASVTIVGVVQKFRAIVELEKTIKNESYSRQQCISRGIRLLAKREDFNFDRDAGDGTQRYIPEPRLLWSIVGVILVLVIFSGLLLASIYMVLCHSGDSAGSTSS